MNLKDHPEREYIQSRLIDYDIGHHEMRLMVLDPKAQALQWIINYLSNVNSHLHDDDEDGYYGSPVTLQEMIETAETHLDENAHWGDYISRGGAFEGMGTDPLFWDKYCVLKDLDPIPDDKKGSFFSCSC